MDQIVGSGRSGERSGALLMWKKSSEQVHNLFHFPAGTTHMLYALERGGEAAMCFYLGVGRSIV